MWRKCINTFSFKISVEGHDSEAMDMCGCQLIGIIEIQSFFTGIAGHRFQVLGSERDLLNTAVNKKIFHEISEQFTSLQSMENDPYGMQRKV